MTLTELACRCSLNLSMAELDKLMSLNMPSNLLVNWQPHSVCKIRTQAWNRTVHTCSIQSIVQMNVVNARWMKHLNLVSRAYMHNIENSVTHTFQQVYWAPADVFSLPPRHTTMSFYSIPYKHNQTSFDLFPCGWMFARDKESIQVHTWHAYHFLILLQVGITFETYRVFKNEAQGFVTQKMN